MVKIRIFGILCAFMMPLTSFAQDDDLLADEPTVKSDEFVDFAFKTTKVVNLQSIEMLGAGVLDFKMNHRFGSVNEGAINAFGLDKATIRFGVEYGVTPNLLIGIGRSNLSSLKNVDGYFKYRILKTNQRQF